MIPDVDVEMRKGQAIIDSYDALAPLYRHYCARREPYLKAIDRLVIEHAPAGATSLLDIGSGDGVRARSIADALAVKKLVLVEPSPAMAALCLKQPAVHVLRTTAERLTGTEGSFDVITCLWNILGLIPDARSRASPCPSRHRRKAVAPRGDLATVIQTISQLRR